MHGSPASLPRPVTTTRVVAVEGGSTRDRPDSVATEEPLEVRLHGPGQEPRPLLVTLRTPGNDFELAAGLCFTTGLVAPGDVEAISYCRAGEAAQRFNVVTVRSRRPLRGTWSDRVVPATAACGLCGTATLDDLEVRCELVGPGPRVAASTLTSLPEHIGPVLPGFGRTGGLHAAARFDADGSPIAIREDVGRHNALDKVIGRAVLDGDVSLVDEILLVSGRLGFELVQKAVVAGAPIVCAVSAPTSLAVAAARRLGVTLVAFLRGARFNVYTHPERVDPAS